jgi:hypothetical protein
MKNFIFYDEEKKNQGNRIKNFMILPNAVIARAVSPLLRPLRLKITKG